MVNIFGNFSGNLGYNIHTRFLTEAIVDRGYSVKIIPYDYSIDPRIYSKLAKLKDKIPDVKNGVSLAITYGHEMTKFHGKTRIGCTVWETTRLPEHWIPQMNSLDEAWAVSEWGKKQFKDSGVEVPIEVVHEGVDDTIFNPFAPRFTELKSGAFKFLSIFKWEKRKAPDILLAAFLQEFGKDDNVQLIIQSFNPFMCNGDPKLWELIKYKLLFELGVPNDPRIAFVPYIQEYKDLARLYCSCDAFVLPTRGEAWGLPLIEAMSCGLPTIATNWSGLTEFMNEDVAYMVDVEAMENAEDPPFIPAYKESKWAKPNIESLKKRMRDVYENREKAKEKGIKAAEFVSSKFTWQVAADTAIARFKEWEK